MIWWGGGHLQFAVENKGSRGFLPRSRIQKLIVALNQNRTCKLTTSPREVVSCSEEESNNINNLFTIRGTHTVHLLKMHSFNPLQKGHLRDSHDRDTNTRQWAHNARTLFRPYTSTLVRLKSVCVCACVQDRSRPRSVVSIWVKGRPQVRALHAKNSLHCTGRCLLQEEDVKSGGVSGARTGRRYATQ